MLFLLLLYSVFKVQLPLSSKRKAGGLNVDRLLSHRSTQYLPTLFSLFVFRLFQGWWAQVDSNYRPRAYQARALTT